MAPIKSTEWSYKMLSMSDTAWLSHHPHLHYSARLTLSSLPHEDMRIHFIKQAQYNLAYKMYSVRSSD